MHSVWLGWLGWACFQYFVLTIFGEIKQLLTFRLFLKATAVHSVCFRTTDLVHSVGLGCLDCSRFHYFVFTLVAQIAKWLALRLFL